MKKIGLASDHAGFELKEYVKTYLTAKGIEFVDYGTHNTDSCDYPDYADKTCAAGIQSVPRRESRADTGAPIPSRPRAGRAVQTPEAQTPDESPGSAQARPRFPCR